MKSAPKLRTLEEVRRDFDRRGASIRAWALSVGVDPQTAAHLVAGRIKGKRGEAHRAAVLLGIKEGVIEPRQAKAGALAAQGA